MASYAECIDIALKDNHIPREIADDIRAHEKPDLAIEELLANIKLSKREAAVQSLRLALAWEDVISHPDGAYDGLSAIMVRDRFTRAAYDSVDKLSQMNRGKYHAQIMPMIQRFRTTAFGLKQDEKGLEELTEAAYGAKVSPDVQGYADDLATLIERIRQDFNKVGGSIPKNKFFNLPQYQDPALTRAVPFEEWFDAQSKWVSIDIMEEQLGRNLQDPVEFRKAMKAVYDNVSTEGLAAMGELTAQRGGVSISKRGSKHRFLYYKDAKSWREANERFGRGDIFASIMEWVDNKSHDIALMQRMGPYPETTYKALRNEIDKSSTPLTQWQRHNLDAQFNTVSGHLGDGELGDFANFTQGISNILTAGQLHSAAISAISDIGFTATTAAWNDIPIGKILKRYVKGLHDDDAIMLGWQAKLTADAATTRMHNSNRNFSSNGMGKTGKIAEVMLRMSGLLNMTNAMRTAFGVEFMFKLSNEFHIPFNKLSVERLRGFKNYGITEEIWDAWRMSKDHKMLPEGLLPNFEAEGGSAFHRMILTETDFAVPVPDGRVESITSQGFGKNTIEGQATHGVFKYKSFLVGILSTHGNRAFRDGVTMEGLGYLGSTLAATTFMGGVALQIKEAINGREPRPADEKLLLAAMVQGGGLPLLGDFLFQDVNRYGGGVTKTLIGPWGDLVDRGVRLTIGNLQQGVQGKDMNLAAEISDATNILMPKVWYTKRIQETMVNSFASMADPDNSSRLQNRDDRREDDYGNKTWWGSNENVLDVLSK